MRTVDFETILAQSLQLTGLDRDNIQEQSFNQIRDFANNRLRYGFEYDVWPDLVRTTLFPVVNEGNKHYIILPENNTVTSTEGTFKVDVGTVLQVTIQDPRTKGKVIEVGWSYDEYETLVGGNVYTTVRRLIVDIAGSTELYVTYRISCPELIGDKFVNTITYQPGQIVYWAFNQNSYFAPVNTTNAKKGNFYKCLVATNDAPSANNPTVGDKWERVRIPAFLGQFIIKAIHADWLKSEMQIQLGMGIEGEAKQLLDFEVHKIIVQQGQSPRLKFNQIY
jgi:hypothetical protein